MLLGEQAPPRIRVAPSRAHANSWEDVADLSASFGLVLDPWQEVVLEAALGERSDGRWSAPQVALSAPRQNGKSQLIVARALAGALLFNEKLIVVSAHQQDTARETFTKMMEQIESSSALSSRIKPGGIMRALNRESITFKNGALIKFKARSNATGRGFSSDCLLLDEAQILGAAAWQTILPTMSARTNPQVWLLGTPPAPTDDSEVFTRIRATALTGKSSRLAYLEWSAEPSDDPAEESTRVSGNPAWYTRINHDIVATEFDSMTRDQFALERLGIWASDVVAQSEIDWDQWDTLGHTAAPSEGRMAYAVRFSADGSRVALAVAVRPAVGVPHVELIKVRDMAAGHGWLVEYLLARWRTCSRITIDGKAGAGALVNALRVAKIPPRVIHTPTTDEVIAAHAMVAEAIRSATLSHFSQTQLDAAVRGAGRRTIGTAGGWGWKPLSPDVDVVPLEAVTLALHALTTGKGGVGRTSGDSTRRAVVM